MKSENLHLAILGLSIAHLVNSRKGLFSRYRSLILPISLWFPYVTHYYTVLNDKGTPPTSIQTTLTIFFRLPDFALQKEGSPLFYHREYDRSKLGLRSAMYPIVDIGLGPESWNHFYPSIDCFNSSPAFQPFLLVTSIAPFEVPLTPLHPLGHAILVYEIHT